MYKYFFCSFNKKMTNDKIHRSSFPPFPPKFYYCIQETIRHCGVDFRPFRPCCHWATLSINCVNQKPSLGEFKTGRNRLQV